MKELELQIKEAMKAEGIDLIGFASRERFANVDVRHNPFSIFPEGKTVIMLGKRICRGSLRGVEEGTNFGDYSLFGHRWLEDEFLSLACYNLVRVLEDQGWEAVPVFPNPPEIKPDGVSVGNDRPEPNVYPDFTYAAVACGIAEIGFGDVLLTPGFGSRQRFHMIITDAQLPQSPLLEKTVCDRCGKCADACPMGAIDKNNTYIVDICGKKMEVAKVDYDKCRTCKNGACPSRFASYAKPDRVAALCNRTCLCHLEEIGAVENKFHAVFRKRDAWSIGGESAKTGRDVESYNVLGGAFRKEATK